MGNSITLVAGTGRTITCTVVALSHTGIAQADESQAYVLIKTAQILAGQSGLVNAIRIRVNDVMGARAAWNHDTLFDYQDRFLWENENVYNVLDWRLSWRDWYLDLWKFHRPNYGTVYQP